MKMVSAIVKHHRLDEVRRALTGLSIHGMTVADVKGFGRQKGHVEVYRGAEYEVKFLPKVKVEVAVADEALQEVVRAIEEAARTGEKGEIGDGKIFVFGLDDAIRIRTGERGEVAI
jgi:nitrogen regulatory protein P-II 2